MLNRKYDCIDALQTAGFNYEDACALRRISMTLHRWHELECGDSNDYASWCITRGRKVRVTRPAASTPCTEFEHDDAGAPFIERHLHSENKARYEAIPDRERGALRRLAKIMQRYSGRFAYHVQGDPRGCALYIIPRDRVRADEQICAEWLEANYTRGIAVCK